MFAYDMLRDNTQPSTETVSGNTSYIRPGELKTDIFKYPSCLQWEKFLSFASAASLKESGNERFNLGHYYLWFMCSNVLTEYIRCAQKC